MSKHKIDFDRDIEELPNYREKGSKKPQYRNGSKPERKSFYLPPQISDKLERQAFWSQHSQNEVVVKILEKFYSNKDFEPVPDRPDDIGDF